MKQGLIILGPQRSGKTTIVKAFAELMLSAYGAHYSFTEYDNFESFTKQFYNKKVPSPKVSNIVVIDELSEFPTIATLVSEFQDYRFIFISNAFTAAELSPAARFHFEVLELPGSRSSEKELPVFENAYILHTGLEAPYDHVYRDAIKLLPSLKVLEMELCHQQEVGNTDAVEMVADEIRDRMSFEDSPCEGCGQLNSDCQCGPGQRDRNEDIKKAKAYSTSGNLSDELVDRFSEEAEEAAKVDFIKKATAANDSKPRNLEKDREAWKKMMLTGEMPKEYGNAPIPQNIEHPSVIAEIERIDQSIANWRKSTTELLNDIKNG